jgi:hypothetical protein
MAEERVSPARSERRSTKTAPRQDVRRSDDDRPVIGLGDHVPSFLLRPVPVRARPQKAVLED